MDTPVSTVNNIAESVYSIDHADHIISVDDKWLQFARCNDAQELTREAVHDKDIWRFISDPDTRVLYRLMFDAVRRRMQPLTVSYRCDSPTKRRFLELTCTPRPNLVIELHSRLLHEEDRPYASVLDRAQPRTDNFVKICAWCSRCRVDELDWREIEDALSELRVFNCDEPPTVTHGMCPDCHVQKLKEIRQGLHARDAR